MKVLVTGATGFVGNQLLIELREQGCEILVTTRNLRTAGVRLPVACKAVEWDSQNGPPPAEIFEGIDAVVNLCGEGVAGGLWTAARKQKIYQSRILSTHHLVETMRELDPKPALLVSASAIGFYGDRGAEYLKEDASSGEGFLAKVCRDWERETMKAEELGVRAVVLRMGMVLGRGGALEKMLPPFRLGLGGPLGGGGQWMSWIHVRDLARMILHVIKNSSNTGVFNAVSTQPVANRDFCKTLAATLRRPAILPVSGFVLRTLLGELSQLFLFSQKVSSEKIQSAGFEFQYPVLGEALREICFPPDRVLQMEQWVPQPVERVFGFFSDAKNLEVLTPPFLNFKIIGTSTESMQEGTLMDYRLKLHGIPFRWQSKILRWREGEGFSDTQTKGPYAYWLHTHDFLKNEGGTLIRDQAEYRLPAGVLGDLVGHPFIRRDLEKIFLYRREKIRELFGS